MYANYRCWQRALIATTTIIPSLATRLASTTSGSEKRISWITGGLSSMGAKIHPHRFTAHVCVAFVDTNTIFLYDGSHFVHGAWLLYICSMVFMLRAISRSVYCRDLGTSNGEMRTWIQKASIPSQYLLLGSKTLQLLESSAGDQTTTPSPIPHITCLLMLSLSSLCLLTVVH